MMEAWTLVLGLVVGAVAWLANEARVAAGRAGDLRRNQSEHDAAVNANILRLQDEIAKAQRAVVALEQQQSALADQLETQLSRLEFATAFRDGPEAAGE